MGFTSRHVAAAGIHASKISGAFNPNPFARTLYVDSSHARAADRTDAGLDRQHPLATLVQAIANANADDTIIVGQGHAETISTATQLDVSTPGLRIIGQGRGLDRPTFTMAGVVGATFTVSGDGVLLQNLHFKPGIAGLTYLLNITGNCPYVLDCLITHDATYQAVIGMMLSDAVHFARVHRLEAYQAAAGAQYAIGWQVSDGLEIMGCRIAGDYSGACVKNLIAATQVVIHGNWLNNLNAVDQCIDLAAACTGAISRNRCRVATDGEVTWIDAGDCDLYENYGVNDDGETGMLIGTPSA